MILIGLNGRLHSGKDTAFLAIQELAAAEDKTARRVGFVDKMKLSGVRALGYEPENLVEAVALANDIKENGTIIVSVLEPKRRFRPRRHRVQSLSGREFWQRYGTEAHREVYGQEFHVDALLPKPQDGGGGILRDLVLEDAFDCDVLVVTDVRFPNEAQRIRALGGKVWKIDADARLGPLPPDSHPSEHGLPDSFVDAKIFNNETLDLFRVYIEEEWKAL